MSPQDFVEANSLSGLIQLAGNPRNIILTTLKPQLKNVTSEDVANSLYYLHLNSDEDAQFLPEEQPIPSRALSKKTLPRKPLPDGSRAQSLDIDRQSVLNLERLQHQAPALDIQKDYTSGHDDIVSPRDNVANTPMVAESGISRRVAGQPSSMARSNTVNRKPLTRIKPQNSIFTPESSQASSPIHNDLETSHRPPSSHTMFERPKPVNDSAKAFSITIIRRDPTSGGQWNVGIVEGKSNPPTIGMTATKKPYYDISVHITTPGYTYFRNHTRPMGNNKLGGTNQTRESQGATFQPSGNEVPTSVTQKAGVSGPGFYSQISMEWASSWNQTFKQHRRAISDFSTNHSRNNSGSSEGPQESDPENRSADGSENSRAKGYTFLSPWELPAPVSADSTASSSSSVTVSELRFNLPSSDLFDREKMDLAAAQVKSGSNKLSRKLGSFRKRLSKSSPHHPSETQPHQTSHAIPYASNGEDLSHLPPRPSSISSSFEEDSPPLTQRLNNFLDELTISNDNDDRLDLSIGQEKAGGGNRGKRAKLGKLIIHDEGLKMLDLIIAANIGVWWTVWNPN
ncbi:hypothetical protein H4I95_11183 [Botrytis cinerea]